MRKEIYFRADGQISILTRDAVDEEKARECFDAIFRATAYKITESNKNYFEKHLNGKPGEKIIFFNKIYPNVEINEDLMINFLGKEGKRNLLIEKEDFPEKNSAEFIGIIFP